MADKNQKTPNLDELEKGPWPSFVKEIKKEAEKNPMADDLLGQLERSYEEKIGHWKHGGIVGVLGYGGGSGLTNMHGSTGDIVFLGTKTDELEPIFSKLTEAGFDLGGSGSDVRTPSCCCGMARCEWACYDTMAVTHFLTMHYQDELHRPAFPYKWKFKMAGCPNDCVASIARADMSVIGTWRDAIQMDTAAITEYAESGMNIQKDVVGNCPVKCMDWDGKKLTIDNKVCRKCMHCINVMPKALRPGKDRGAAILIGAKAPIVEGALLSSVLIPFIKLEPPYTEFIELVDEIP
jgi:sulfite reductase alpha subunit